MCLTSSQHSDCDLELGTLSWGAGAAFVFFDCRRPGGGPGGGRGASITGLEVITFSGVDIRGDAGGVSGCTWGKMVFRDVALPSGGVSGGGGGGRGDAFSEPQEGTFAALSPSFGCKCPGGGPVVGGGSFTSDELKVAVLVLGSECALCFPG